MIQEELKAASQKVIQLTRYILGLQNRLPITKPSSRQLTNICKKRTELYKLCRTLRHTLSSEAENASNSGHASSKMNWSVPSPTLDQRPWRLSTTSDASSSGLQPEVRLPPVSSPNGPSSGPLLLDRELRALTKQLRQEFQLPQLQVKVLDLCLGHRSPKASGPNSH
jgi:hypothetical protein